MPPRGKWRRSFALWAGLGSLLLGMASSEPARAQSAWPAPEGGLQADPDTMGWHLHSERVWISGQVNIVFQWHPPFRSPYQGVNSLSPQAQSATTHIVTLMTAYRFARWSQLVLQVEDATGSGLGNAQGLAGFPNLDVVREAQGIPLASTPYLARVLLRQVIPLSDRLETAERDPLNLWEALPAHRIEVWLGKFSVVDFFDQNSVVGDDHFGFLNWTVANNGAYDYAANTRGYTDGLVVMWVSPQVRAVFAETLMPKAANDIHLDADLARAHAENAEVTLRLPVGRGGEGKLRLLSFVNHGNMGSYAHAIGDFLAGRSPQPDVTAHPRWTSIKYGFGANLELPLRDWLGAFARWGWNEGQHESFVYTEVDQTVALGVGGSGMRWRRPRDRFGAAWVSNGISRVHQDYLRLGGHGFLLGDGRLNYAREDLVEVFYTVHAWRGLFPAVDLQRIDHPGYNRDRGPVTVASLRLHVEF